MRFRNFDNKKLPNPSKNRTGVNDIERLKELHDAIKCTPNSYFKLLQDFVTNIKQKKQILKF
jgi:hypothetical protein